MRYLFICVVLIFTISVKAQHTLTCVIKDSVTSEPLPGTIITYAPGQGGITDVNGKAIVKNIPDGMQSFRFSYTGYKTIVQQYNFPLSDTSAVFTILLSSENQQLDEVVVSSTRTNSRIDDLNTKVEVLGEEDMDEESTVVPGSVTSILGDLSIITIQKTNPVNGNEAIRMQGLDPRYTQIMRDGLPLYGGFSGSLGVLSIPPLDLKQVEIIKGSASTLYGGGAISGLINFISKVPADSAQTTITMNVTTLKEFNLNAFTSQKKEKLGLTLFAGANVKTANDVNGDGFAEVPEQKDLSLHPRFFYTINKKNQLALGLTTAYDTRRGGDIAAILSKADSAHPFLQIEKTFRNTFDASLFSQFSENNSLTFKTAVSVFQRSIDYSGFVFNGNQYSSYSEISDFIKLKKHELVIGGNFSSETFQKEHSDSVLFHNYDYNTMGVFVQDEWQLAPKLSMQAGMRYDYHNKYKHFILPRLSFFMKANQKISIRLAAGTGYKVPNLFDFAEPSDPITDVMPEVKPEHSYGVNSDINFHTLLFDALLLQVNEALYYTHIDNPLQLTGNLPGSMSVSNGSYYVNSYGTDTYIRLAYKEAELYLGYNHTESLRETSVTYSNMPFNPKDKFSTTLAYDMEGKWRMGVEASLTANQYIYGNQKVRDFWFAAAMIERKFRHGSIVLNCENLFDTRQSGFETLVEGSRTQPFFKTVWAPLEGRSVNLSIKLCL